MLIRNKSPIVLLTVALVFANILLPPIIAVLLVLLFVAVMAVAVYKWTEPAWSPKFGTGFIDRIINHVKICPYEIFLVVGVIFFTILPIFHFGDTFYHLTSSLLIVFAFGVSELGRLAADTGQHGFRSLLELVIQPGLHRIKNKEKHVNQRSIDFQTKAVIRGDEQEKFVAEYVNDTEAEADGEGAGAGEITTSFKTDQERRWQDWVNEELYRLSGGESSFDAK